MTSGNDPGQGTRSATTEIGDELENTQVRDGATPGTEPPADAAEPEPAGEQAEDTESDTKAADLAAGQDDAAEKATGGTVIDRIAQKSAPEASDAAEPPTDSKPIPTGFWRSAYEAGAEAPSSRYTTDTPASSNGTPGGTSPSLGSAIENATAPAGSQADDDIEDTTRPRSVPRGTPPQPLAPPSDAWRREPTTPAADAPGATPEAADVPGATPSAAAENETAGQGRDGDDPATAVRQGAVKAAQAALAAARNAAKKVSSATPEASPQPAAQAQPAPPAPPEMHYTAGAVRGTASTPVEETVPVGAGGRPEGDTTPGPAPSVAPRPSSGPRRVRLAISRIDPWSVMKLAFLLSVAIAIMTVVATVVFWSVIDSLGVFDKVQTFVTDAIGEETNFNVMQYVEFERVVSLATLVAICNVVLLTALATIMTFLYNITAALVGGMHMTLTDD